MKRFIDAVKKALENENWYSALIVALTLPDICGKIQYPNLKSGERYIKWFNNYLSNKYTHKIGPDFKEHVFLSGEDCYALRCSFLHEGLDEISHQKCRKVLDSFLFMTGGPHCNFFNVNNQTFLQLRVDEFCKDVCSAVETWVKDIAGNAEIEKQISELIRIHFPGVVINGIRFG
jgi:hypothetical protein